MRIERNLKLIGLFSVCSSAFFQIPVLLPYYSEQIGLGYREFLIGEAAFAATIILFDVPTGWIADIWQRKHTLALGIFTHMVGFGLLLPAHSLWQVVLAQTVLGMGFSLISGTHTAMLYDVLLSAGRENEYRRREGKRQALALYSLTMASIAGGFFYSINHFLPLVLTILMEFMAFLAANIMDEPARHKRIGEKHPIADIIDTVKYALHGHAEVGFIIFFAAALFCSSKLIMWSQQPYYMALHLPKAMYGVLMAVGFGLGGASSHWAHLLDGKVGTFRALTLTWAVALLVCIGAGSYLGLSGVGLLMLGGSCIFGTASPRVNEAINRLVGSERRATILSTLSLMISVFFIPVSSMAGWVSARWGIQASLFAIAAWLCVAGLCLGGLARWRSRIAIQP